MPPLPRTIILDYYDSYTNNLLTLFTQLYTDEEVRRKVVVIKADRYTWKEFQSTVLPSIDCVILSPGPGRPDNPTDIGFALDLLRSQAVPILGVCLGHQAIGVAFGAKIINTPRITHGHVVPVLPVLPALGLFAASEWARDKGGTGEFDVVVYNSLTVDPASLPKELEVTAWSTKQGDEQTIQGLAHRDYPIWGVQYHPESISSTRGHNLLQAFLSRVHTHHSQPNPYPPLSEHIISSCAYRITAGSSKRRIPLISPYPTPPMSRSGSPVSVDRVGATAEGERLRLVERRYAELGREARTADLFQAFVRGGKGKERALGEVWLDGATPTRPTTTSLSTPSFLLTYTLSSRRITLHRPSQPTISIYLDDETFWDWFAEGQKQLAYRLDLGKRGESYSSRGKGWSGGWVGWFGYEMGGESLAGYLRPHRSTTRGVTGDEGEAGEVDAAWAWCDRILERQPDGEWIARGVIRDEPIMAESSNEDGGMISWLESHHVSFGLDSSAFDQWATRDLPILLSETPAGPVLPIAKADFPEFRPRDTEAEYRRRIGECREAICQGESYELTLTTRFTSTLSPDISSFIPSANTSSDPLSLYLHVRKANPAYYSTYISLPYLSTPRGRGLTILSSSPERFLRVEKGVVEMMPIKGTLARVKPGQCVCREAGKGCEGGDKCEAMRREVDRLRGEELMRDPKERAENLMIVDLIRADLLSSCIPSTVQVPKLIALESYGVHNLVTTVRGQLAPNVGVVEAVRGCFPPGSMTGAPKLRSVRLLEGIEKGERRGIYSGCLGYFSLDGMTDLSVVIRTMVLEGHQLSLGAGGAITWLSNPEGEWDEVLTKVKSVVGSLPFGNLTHALNSITHPDIEGCINPDLRLMIDMITEKALFEVLSEDTSGSSGYKRHVLILENGSWIKRTPDQAWLNEPAFEPAQWVVGSQWSGNVATFPMHTWVGTRDWSIGGTKGPAHWLNNDAPPITRDGSGQPTGVCDLGPRREVFLEQEVQKWHDKQSPLYGGGVRRPDEHGVLIRSRGVAYDQVAIGDVIDPGTDTEDKAEDGDATL